MPANPLDHLFVVYSREDRAQIEPILTATKDEFEARGIPLRLWSAVEELRAGESWEDSISAALQAATGLLVFVSAWSIDSEVVQRELSAAAALPDLFVLPVTIDAGSGHHPLLADIQHLAAEGQAPAAVAEHIALATLELLQAGARPPVSEADADQAARGLARDARARPERRSTAASQHAVFVVHGHDQVALEEVEEFLGDHGIEPVVLTRIGGASQSLLQKFLQWSSDIQFAIVLMTADDLGASRRQFESTGVGERALQFRTRQNVILELGFFYGLLGWENVFVLFKNAEAVFPNFERPSDLDGVVFDDLDAAGTWKVLLGDRLRAARLVGVSARSA